MALRCIFILFIILAPVKLLSQNNAEIKFVDGRNLTLSGKPETDNPDSYYDRLDDSQLPSLPKKVAELSKMPSGLNITFKSDATQIDAKWTLEEYRNNWKMTPLAVNGLDLYGWNGKEWQYISSARPIGKNNNSTIIKNLDGKMRHYKVYLPLYSDLEEIAIGINQNSVIEPADSTFIPKKKVLIYGSSITQGASASRPGMAYPSLLSRNLNIETYNYGFSGHGEMEIEVAEVLGKIESDLIVLDCVPNPTVEQIKNRAVPFILKLRELQPHTPILMVESIFREKAHWDNKWHAKVTGQNKAWRAAYKHLASKGVENLYYMPSTGFLGSDHEATTDGTHPSDLGMFRIANEIRKGIENILNI